MHNTQSPTLRVQLQVPGRRSDRAPQSGWGWLLCIVLGLWLACGGPGVCPAPRRAGSSHTALLAWSGELAGSKVVGGRVCVCKFCAWCVCAVCVCGVWCECNKMHAAKMNRSPYQFTCHPPSLLRPIEDAVLSNCYVFPSQYLYYLRVWPRKTYFAL